MLFICLMLNSCAVTQSMWIARSEGDIIDSFFIDQEKNRIVLIGEQHPITKAGDHYSISEPTGKLAKVLKFGETSGVNFWVFFYDVKASGANIYAQDFKIGFDLPNKSSSETKDALSKLATNNYFDNQRAAGVRFSFSSNNQAKLEKARRSCHNAKYGGDCPIPYKILNTEPIMTRYPSSQEPIKNFCSETNQEPSCTKIIKFSKPWQGVIWNRYTNSEKAIRIAATPFTIVADILLTPLYLVGFIGMGISDGAGNVDPRVPQSTSPK